jgi:hypothetical protein
MYPSITWGSSRQILPLDGLTQRLYATQLRMFAFGADRPPFKWDLSTGVRSGLTGCKGYQSTMKARLTTVYLDQQGVGHHLGAISPYKT